MTDSEVRERPQGITDSAERKAVWEASKGVGPLVEADLKELVKLRNEAAASSASRTITPCSSISTSRTQEQVLKLFDELDDLTREPFPQPRPRSTPSWPSRCGIKVDELRPGTITTRSSRKRRPSSRPTSTRVYAKADILKLCRDFYAGIGLPIDDVIARSDLYEKQGKSPHAFCTDIDREGDVRVLANIVPNEYWMGTMLHEFGHSVYSSKNIPRERALRAAHRVAHPDHRGRGHDVRAVLEARRLAGEDGRRTSPTRRRSTRPAPRCSATSC